MSHTRPRLGRHALVLAIAMLLVVPVGARATTISYSGDTLIVTGGDNTGHSVQFRYDGATGRDNILDNQTITSAPGDCQYEGLNSWVSCPATAA